MKLIANLLCRGRYKAQTRFNRWFRNKEEKIKKLIQGKDLKLKG